MHSSPDQVTLNLLREPSLLPQDAGYGVHAYRFFWTRTFHEARLFRLTVEPNHTGTVVRKAYQVAVRQGHIAVEWIEDNLSRCNASEIVTFLGALEPATFWSLEPEDKSHLGMDGSNWMIEGLRYGRYHAISRWTPDDERVRALGLAFLTAGGYESDSGSFY